MLWTWSQSLSHSPPPCSLLGLVDCWETSHSWQFSERLRWPSRWGRELPGPCRWGLSQLPGIQISSLGSPPPPEAPRHWISTSYTTNHTTPTICRQKVPFVEHLDGAEYPQMMLCLLLEDEDLEGVMISPGSDLGSVETVEGVHLAKDIPDHVWLGELQRYVALPLFDVLTPHHGQNVGFTPFLELFVQLSHHSGELEREWERPELGLSMYLRGGARPEDLASRSNISRRSLFS